MTPSLLRAILAQEGLTAAGGLKRLKLTDSRGAFFIEVTPQQAAALKLVPGGSEFKVDRQAGKIFGASWSKRGGYADVISKKFHQQLKVLGFHLVESKQDAHPADFYTQSSGTYKDSEGTVAYSSSHYGQVKSQNSFSISVHFKYPVRILGDEADAEHQEEVDRQAPARDALEVLKKTSWVNDPRVDRGGRAVGIIDKAVIPEWARPYVVEGTVYTSGSLPRWKLELKRNFKYGNPPYFGSYDYDLRLGSRGYEWEGGAKAAPEDIEKALTVVLNDIRNAQPDDLWGKWLERESLAVALGAKPGRNAAGMSPELQDVLTQGGGSIVYQSGAKLITDNGSYFAKGKGKFAAWDLGTIASAEADLKRATEAGKKWVPFMKVFKTKPEAMAWFG